VLGFNRWHLFKSLAAILCIAGIVSLAAAYFIPAPPTTVTIATAYKGSTFVFYGEKYREIFARAHVKLELRETNGAVDNLRLLRDPKSGVDIGFVSGGLSQGDPPPGLLSTFWIFYRSTETLDRFSQLKGKRIAVGPEGSGVRFTAEQVLGAGGINSATATFLPYAGTAAADALKDGKVDVAWVLGGTNAGGVKALTAHSRRSAHEYPNGRSLHQDFPGARATGVASRRVRYRRQYSAQ
jgi:TRAP-type uncharacterized transport system substrate-binding protein